MNYGWYDEAQICLNGHIVNLMSISRPEHNRKFCERCGAPTITKCQYCNAPINGFCHEGPITKLTADEFDIDGMIEEIANPPPNIIHDYDSLPSFCPECGKTYPWTEAKLKAAKELSNEFENLSSEERKILKKSLDDIIRDTPQTPVSATRFKKIVAKAGKAAADSLKDILVDIASEAAKKMIWPS
jgi:hypothetical protein